MPAAHAAQEDVRMRVVYWARLGLARPQVTAALEAVPGALLTVVETLPELLAALPGAEALVTYDAPPPAAREVVAALSAPGATVRWMHLLTAGREGFEAAGLPRALAVTWAAGAVAPTVAEHAMALLLALARRIPEMAEQTRAARWDRAPAARAVSLEGGTLALIGFGHIGREVARRAQAFGMRVVALTRRPAADPLVDEALPLDALHEVLPRADAIVVALALAPATRHLLDAEAFARCRPGALLVNVARGGLVDQAALRAALERGALGGAALDVTEPEPLPPDDPLWGAPNLIVSPHFAGGGSRTSLARLADGAAANLRRLMAGEPLMNLVPD
ncbi:MAG: NAD(P)-binding domain-containing protein [Acetobacteraceae bacterium]|nr:NAD(P)-binding domain-containing protein [Acetobacteraceae bacterium]